MDHRTSQSAESVIGHQKAEDASPSIKIRWGFKSHKQLPLFMVWREYWDGGEVIDASVLFSSREWIGF